MAKMCWMKMIYVILLRVTENDWMLNLNIHMKRISDKLTKSRISTFSVETDGNNANNI